MTTSLYSIKKDTHFGLLIFSVTQETSYNTSTATIKFTCPITGIDIKRTVTGHSGCAFDAVQAIVKGELVSLKEKMLKK